MATINDPRAAGFDAARFRDGIKFAMRMGMPDATEEVATFQWTPEKTYQTADASGRPYSFTQAPTTTTTHADVVVDVAVEFQRYSSGEGNTSIGEFQTTSVVLTLLDVDFTQIQGSDKVLLGGNTYTIDYVAPPFAMFDVTVYQIYCKAEDES